MSELYGDHDSFGAAGSGRLIPDGLRRLIGAALFLGVVGAMGLWAYRLGTRDAAEVPIIRAMEGPARIQPEDPGGLRAAHQGLEVNCGARRAGADARRRRPPRRSPRRRRCSRRRTARRASWSSPTPAPLADVELSPDADLRMPLADDGAAADARRRSPPTSDVAAVAPEAAAAPDAPVVDATSMAALVEAAVEPPRRGRPGPRPMRRPANLPRARAAARRGASRRREPRPPRRPLRSPRRARSRARVPGARMVQLGAYDSEANTRKAWNQLVGQLRRPAGREEPLHRADHRQRPGVLPPARRGLREHRPDPRDVRGAARPRRRLHPGDVAVDGGARRHPRLRRAGPDRGRAVVLRRGRTPGASSCSRATSRRPTSCAG